MQMRRSARLAFVKADSDARIRRALLRRHRIFKMTLAVGQKCFYWRHAGAPRLQKNRWRGPAHVVMVEKDENGRPTTYWLVHATALIRCAPEHVRALIDDSARDVKDDLAEAKTALDHITKKVNDSVHRLARDART